MIRKETLLVLFLLLVNLAYFHFFRPLHLNDIELKAIYYLFLGTTILLSLKTVIHGPITHYGGLLRCIILSIIISMCSAYIFWNQSLVVTFVASLPFLSFFIFFFLWEQNTKIDTIEIVIWIFCVIFLVCFFYALFRAPTRVFAGYGELGKEIDTSRGIYRIRLTIIGGGPLYLAYFCALVKYKNTKRKRWLAATLFLLAVIVMQLGRQSILFSVLVSVFFLLSKTQWKKKALLLTAGLTVWYLLPDNMIINKMMKLTQNQYEAQVLESKEDIRLSAYKFYLFDVSPSFFNIVFGNGMYALGKSDYGNFIDRYGRGNGYIPADVGYASIYLFFGIFGLGIFALITIRVLNQHVPESYIYAKMYIIFLMLGSFAGDTLLGSIPTLCMALYILDRLDRTIKTAKERNTTYHNRTCITQGYYETNKSLAHRA